MSKDKNFLSQIGKAYILYKFGGVILFGIIVFVVIFLIVSPEVDKEYQKYGYTGLTDSIKYDEYTGEIIPKSQIETYDNSDKYIINTNGRKVTFSEIQELIDQYASIQGSFASFKSDKVEELDNICNTLLREYLVIDYEIVHFDGENSNQYRFQVRGEFEDSYYSWFSTPSDLKSLVKEVVKKKYRSGF